MKDETKKLVNQIVAIEIDFSNLYTNFLNYDFYDSDVDSYSQLCDRFYELETTISNIREELINIL